MRLKHLDIRGFGRLRGRFPLDVGDGHAALLLERNESGKSTLAAAILAALYGLEADRRRSRGALVEKDVYQPWSGGSYALSLELECRGEILVIDRDFQQDSARVLRGGEDITDRYRRGSHLAIGEKLTGLSRRQFTLSTFMRQGDLVWDSASDLSDALQRVADSQTGEKTAAAALEVLEGALNQYDGRTLKTRGKVETEIARLEKGMDAAREELQALESEREGLAEAIHSLASVEGRMRVWDHQRRLLRHRRLLAESQECETQLRSDFSIREKIREGEHRLGEGAHLLAIDPDLQQEIQEQRRMLDQLAESARKAAETAEGAEKERHEILQERKAIGLQRRPDEEDRDTLRLAQARIQDAQEISERMIEKLDEEKADLASRGTGLDEALALARSFRNLSEEDHSLLSDRTRWQVSLQEKRQAREQELSDSRQERNDILARRRKQLQVGMAIAALGALLLILSMTLLSGISFVWIPAAIVLILGALAIQRARGLGQRPQQEVMQRMERAQEALREVAVEEGSSQEKWEALARKLQLRPAELEDRYRMYRAIERQLDTLERLDERIQEAERDERAAMDSLRELWTIFGDTFRIEELDERLSLLTRGIEIYRQADRAVAVAGDLRRESDESRNLLSQQQHRVRRLLSNAGVDIDAREDLTGAFDRFQQMIEKGSELRLLQDQLLPQLQKQLLSGGNRAIQEERISSLRQEMARLQQSLEENAVRHESLAETLHSVDQPLDQQAFDEAIAGIDNLERASHREEEERRATAQAFLSRYEQEAPRLREEIHLAGRALKRAVEFKSSVELARDTLQAIASQTHRNWSSALNRHAGEILAGMGSEVSHLRFDEQLRLSMQQDGKVLTGSDACQQLSVGALDGVFLAARIAVSRFLSGEEMKLPLILDDPFANSDDPRMLQGLSFILEVLAPHQQILLMACQHSRYRWARAQLGDPDSLVVLEAMSADEESESARG